MKVYLAGPITGLTYADGQDWRAAAVERFAASGIQAISPLRGKGYLRSLGTLLDQYHGIHPLSEEKGIVSRDRNDVRTSDVILANLLGAERVSIGTMIEFGWADAFRTPVVAVMEPDNIHRHGMATQIAGWVTPDLEDAIRITMTVLGLDVSMEVERAGA